MLLPDDEALVPLPQPPLQQHEHPQVQQGEELHQLPVQELQKLESVEAQDQQLCNKKTTH